jgi:hypothetical protein
MFEPGGIEMGKEITVDQRTRGAEGVLDDRPATAVGVASLTGVERSRFSELVYEISTHADEIQRRFVKIGLALTEIRTNRLYREGYGTFEAFCEALLGFSASRARQLIAAAETATLVTVAGLPTPANERQVRELIGLRVEGEQEIVDAWRSLCDEYGAKNVTSDLVKHEVTKRLEFLKTADERQAKRRAEKERRKREQEHLEIEANHRKWVDFAEYMEDPPPWDAIQTEIAYHECPQCDHSWWGLAVMGDEIKFPDWPAFDYRRARVIEENRAAANEAASGEIERLKRKSNRLQRENDDLRKGIEIKRLRRKNDKLRRVVDDLRAENGALLDVLHGGPGVVLTTVA